MNAKITTSLKRATYLASGAMLAIMLLFPAPVFAQAITKTAPTENEVATPVEETTDATSKPVPQVSASEETVEPEEPASNLPNVCEQEPSGASPAIPVDTETLGTIICVNDEGTPSDQPEKDPNSNVPDTVPAESPTEPQEDQNPDSTATYVPMRLMAVTELDTNVQVPPKLGSISGFKLNDLNGDGLMQDNEPKLSGWTITFSRACGENSECSSDIIKSAITDSNGNYMFDNVAAGTYRVCEVPQDGWKRTFPKDSDCTITIVDAGEDCFENFANMQIKKEVPPTPQVLSSITPPHTQELANTGTPLLANLMIGLTLIAVTSGTTYLSRSKKAIALIKT